MLKRINSTAIALVLLFTLSSCTAAVSKTGSASTGTENGLTETGDSLAESGTSFTKPAASVETSETSPAAATSEIADFEIISPGVSSDLKPKLLSSIEAMKQMGPGVGPWEVIYCNNEKIIIYNYAFVVGIDLTEKNKGIYSVIGLDGLKVGSYQGSEIASIHSGPDATACVIGTFCGEKDVKCNKSLYVCDLKKGSVSEVATDFNMAGKKVEWYKKASGSGTSPWIVSVTGADKGMVWDIAGAKKLSRLPDLKQTVMPDVKYMDKLDVIIGYNYYSWWKNSEDTVVGAPYRQGAATLNELKLIDFEIIEVNLSDGSCKTLYRIPD